MPTRKSKTIKQSSTSEENEKKELAELIQKNIQELNDEPEGDYTATRKIVCQFYRAGGNPGCIGCRQPDETLNKCKNDYLETIESRPRKIWDKTFDELEVREKVKVNSIIDIGLNCDSCYLAEHCPVYKKHAMCGIDWGEEGSLTPKKIAAKLVDIQFKRVNRGSKIEEMDGGVPDQTLSAEIDRLTELAKMQNDLNIDKFELNMNVKGQAQNSGTGLLASLLSGAKPTPQGTQQQVAPEKEETRQIEDIPFTQVVIPDVQKVKKRR